MKQMVCEMCGSTDLLKQDGMFVCQTCGTKYSVEEAKKMMVEGTVEVTGTVKVDDTSKIDNYYTMAENAYTAGNKQEAENYCNKVIEIDPTHCKAWLLKGKAAGWQSTIRNLRIEESVNCFTKAIDSAVEDEVEMVKKEAASEISSLSIALMTLSCNNFSEYPSNNNKADILGSLKMVQVYSFLLLIKCGVKPNEFYKKVADLMNSSVCDAWGNIIMTDYQHTDHPTKFIWEEFKERCFSCISILTAAINLTDEDKEADIQYYKNLITITSELVKSCSYTYVNGGYLREWSLTDEAKEELIDKIMDYHERIKETDSTHEIPARSTYVKSPSGGCYIATAVYGSYDCPQVWTLRRYRDDILAKTWYGRAFIHIYYAISPVLVKWFGENAWFKRMCQPRLDCMVDRLQSEGVESTPYMDKEW